MISKKKLYLKKKTTSEKRWLLFMPYGRSVRTSPVLEFTHTV